jgi:hypothetical protein
LIPDFAGLAPLREVHDERRDHVIAAMRRETAGNGSKKQIKPKPSHPMHENEIAKVIVDAAYHIHVELGPGLLEI